MRTVLIGSDFMYDKDGNLKPIEINTAVGWDGIEKIEDDVDCLDLTSLHTFIDNNNFQWLPDLNIEFILTKDRKLRAIVFNRNSLDIIGGSMGRRNRQGVSISYRKDFEDFIF